MANRRDVLKTGAALSLAGSPFATAFAAGAPALALALQRFVFDVRFAASGAMGEHMQRLGIARSPIADDLMTLRYDELDLAWRLRQSSMAVGS